MPSPPPDLSLTQAELARRHGVDRSAVHRALKTAWEKYDSAPDRLPKPPSPVNPGQPQPRYDPAEFDSWWHQRPKRGRPPAPSRTDTTER
ncbi:MarR family transcriptional regulator [Kitasatospora sp. NPDC059160]|uniref:MarR family transcriptional regulator n=1 Tax=Kitasatospora sp. NPDC059160 TaxID=3346748 RepID=UPI0036B555CC